MGDRFGCEPENHKVWSEFGGRIWEGVYVREHGRLSNSQKHFWTRGFTTGQLDDLLILLAEGPSFRGPHEDGYPEKPVMATLIRGVKLWAFLTGSATATRFFIRRIWTMKELSD